jgi:hypothetical protein
VKALHAALREAYRAGDLDSVKRLTALLAQVLYAPTAKDRIH